MPVIFNGSPRSVPRITNAKENAQNIIPIYISELSPPAIRGRLVGLYELGWQIGGLVGFWINVSS